MILPVDELWEEASSSLWDYLMQQGYEKEDVTIFLIDIRSATKQALVRLNERAEGN